MADFFSGLITEEFKQLHVKMIDTMLEDTAFTVPCTLVFGATKWSDCNNCIFDPIGGKSSNRYTSGGPIPFYHGTCPACFGSGKLLDTSTETIYLMPFWDSKDWYPLGQTQVSMAEVEVQTMSRVDTYDELKRCSTIIIDTTKTAYGIPDFVRVGDPQMCGLGEDNFIITSWKRK